MDRSTYDGTLTRIRLPPLPRTAAIFLSDVEGASSEFQLRLHHIDTVISLLGNEEELPHYDGIEYIRFFIHDGEGDIVDIARQVALIIDAAPHKQYLIHCMAGVSRSASVVIYYVMHKLKMPYRKAKQLVKQSRRIIHPSSHYVQQLSVLEPS